MRVPAGIVAVATPAATTTVGSVAGSFSVKVTDHSGAALRGVVVTFVVRRGNGRVDPLADTTSADGLAATMFTVSTAPGVNEVSATVSGIEPATVSVLGVLGATRSVAVTPRVIRLPISSDSIVLSATARDSFSNITADPIAWVSRDPALVSAASTQNNQAMIRVVNRPGSTYVVASSGSAIDSVLVAVHDAGSTPCAFMTPPVAIPVGDSFALDSSVACVRSTGSDGEFVLVAHYNTAVTDISSRVQVLATGIMQAPASFPPASLITDDPSERRDLAFELALRRREAHEIGAHIASAREWSRARRTSSLRAVSSEHAIPEGVRTGDLLALNVNANDFCTNPETIGARVAAISDGAIILADTANPAGGFTDAEYRELADIFDTLVNPVDTSAFGAPSDIDNNRRVGILFTRAVNDLTPRGATSIVLGFYYIRDLLPRTSPFGLCPGSNVGEMFYLMVPDPNGTTSDARPKAFVQGVTVATIAHEYQHLINASRRMYITEAPQVDEEIWLNEGLSHIAEELVFFHSSGRTPRANIDGSLLGLGSETRMLFDKYQRGNFSRYREYLQAPEPNSPLSDDGRLATRGATWSFLRYLADRSRTTDGDLWHKLVNSRWTGTTNLDAALVGTGTKSLEALQDWSMSLAADDIVATTNAQLQQASWNFVSAMPATGISMSYPLFTRFLTDADNMAVTIRGGGSSYLRFVVRQDNEALIQINGFGGAPLPAGIRISVVRIR